MDECAVGSGFLCSGHGDMVRMTITRIQTAFLTAFLTAQEITGLGCGNATRPALGNPSICCGPRSSDNGARHRSRHLRTSSTVR